MIRITTAHYTRITKQAARRLYDAGADVYFCPVKLNPENPWGLLYYPGSREASFDDHVKLFEVYNCTSETGQYTAFYIPRTEGGKTTCF